MGNEASITPGGVELKTVAAETNHTTISVAMVATAASGLGIAVAKHHGLDLAGQEANIGTLALAACYLIQRRLQSRGALPGSQS